MKFKTQTTAILTAGLATISGTVFAGETPTLSDVLAASGIEVSGYVDTSYTYNPESETALRTFDSQLNSFNLNMLGLSISSLPEEGLGGAVVLNAGEDANMTASTGTGSADEFDVQQAYVNYSGNGVQVMAGKFATLQGAEVIESKDNLNFSRAILFGYAIPFTHTGVRTSYAVNDALTLTAGVNNGWDNLKDDNGSKSVEFQAAFAPSDSWFVNVQGMLGNEAGTAGVGSRALVDIVAGIDVSERLSFMLNADFGSQEKGKAGGGKATWAGYAAYANFKFAPKWRVASRVEYFEDNDGFRSGTAQAWKEGTVTLAFSPVAHVELRGEVRHDWSNKDVFNFSTKSSQDTFALEGIYTF